MPFNQVEIALPENDSQQVHLQKIGCVSDRVIFTESVNILDLGTALSAI